MSPAALPGIPLSLNAPHEGPLPSTLPVTPLVHPRQSEVSKASPPRLIPRTPLSRPVPSRPALTVFPPYLQMNLVGMSCGAAAGWFTNISPAPLPLPSARPPPLLASVAKGVFLLSPFFPPFSLG